MFLQIHKIKNFVNEEKNGLIKRREKGSTGYLKMIKKKLFIDVSASYIRPFPFRSYFEWPFWLRSLTWAVIGSETLSVGWLVGWSVYFKFYFPHATAAPIGALFKEKIAYNLIRHFN